MTTTMAYPWQLYVFSLLNIAAGIFCCFSNYACELAFGDCAEVDVLMTRCLAICLMYVGVLFLVLAFMNHKRDGGAKLKALTMVATQCAVAMFVGIVMAGPGQFGGVEKGWAHLGDMFTFAVLLIIMWTGIADDKEVAGCSNLFSGLGINPKTLLWLFLIGSVVKVFLLTDFMSYHYLVDDPDVTSELARVLWNLMAVLVLEIALVLFFAIGYGDYRDQEVTIITVVVMTIVSGIATIGVHYSLMGQYIISLVVLIVLAVIAVLGGRRENRSTGYTEVGNI